MKKNLLFFLALFFFASQLFAQTGREVNGVVKDTAGVGVFGVILRLIPQTEPSDTLLVRTNIDGIFTFRAVPVSQFTINVSSLGYESTSVRSVSTPGTSKITIPTIVIKQGASMLAEVVISGAPPVTIKEDTIEYRAADFKLREDALVEDLIKKVDGAEVSKDGAVTQNGKAVTKFRVDGKDFFGGDLATAMKNIPANAVDKIQFIDDYGDQANFTGVRDGDPETIINITTRPGRNTGMVGNALAGGGTREGVNDLYAFNAFGSQFKGERNIGFTANLNNSNLQSVGGGGGFGGRGGAGGGGQQGGGGNSGISTVSQVALNYTNRWSPKLVVTAAYNYSGRENNAISNNIGENTSKLGTIFSRSNVDNLTNNNTHGANTTLTYNINPRNLMVIRANVSLASSDGANTTSSFQTGVIKQDYVNTSGTKSKTPSFGTNITYSHVFPKAGRNYSLNLNLTNNESRSDNDTENNTLYYNTTNGSLLKDSLYHRLITNDNLTMSAQSRFVFSEPLNLTSRLQFSYNIGYTGRDNSKITNFTNSSGNLVPIDSLSNIFNTTFLTQTVGLNYNYRSTNNELRVGIQAIPTLLKGTSETLNTEISRSGFNIAPIFSYTYRYSRTRTIQANYNGNASEPQFAQLQPVRDVSNPQNPIVGNPNLDASFNHNMNLSYNNSNPTKRTSFMLRFQGGMVSNSIVSNRVLVPDAFGSLKTETRYVNTNGNYNYGANYSTQKSFKDRQYTVSLRGSAGFRNQVGFADNIKTFSETWSFSQRLGLQINPGSWMELTPNVNWSLSQNRYSQPTQVDRDITTYQFNVDGKLYFLKARSLIMGFTTGKQINKGYSTGNNTNPMLVDAYLEQQFLKNKMASLKLSAYDLFNESTNIQYNATSTGFNESSTNRLTQYFMLTLTMKINRFAGGAGAPQGQGQQGQGQGRGQGSEFPTGGGGFPGGGGQRGGQGGGGF